jgi:hypothetical protein
MRLDPDDAKKFQKLKKYLESDFAHLAHDDKLIKALQKAGAFEGDDDTEVKDSSFRTQSKGKYRRSKPV